MTEVTNNTACWQMLAPSGQWHDITLSQALEAARDFRWGRANRPLFRPPSAPCLTGCAMLDRGFGGWIEMTMDQAMRIVCEYRDGRWTLPDFRSVTISQVTDDSPARCFSGGEQKLTGPMLERAIAAAKAVRWSRGKYSTGYGATLGQIMDKDPGYLRWIAANVTSPSLANAGDAARLLIEHVLDAPARAEAEAA